MDLEVTLKEAGKLSRLTNRTFQFDPKLGTGFYAANYFLKTNQIVKNLMPGHSVTMQFFQRSDDIMVCGLDEAIALVHTFAHYPETLTIQALDDGDVISSGEPVLKITGLYENFGFLESMIDGILSRRTSVATNTMKVLRAAHGKPVFSMADRQDDYHTQTGDGYASFVAGIRKVSTDAQGLWWGGKGMGTMPHALIQICDGDIKLAAELYHKTFPDAPITALIDYNNDVVNDSLMLARHLNGKLAAVRIDTSMALIDHYFDDKDTSGFDPHGVCKELVFGLRQELDKAGFNEVNIIISSGFTSEKIASFEAAQTPVDMYGVGGALVPLIVNFTGDLVNLDGKPQAKVGRTEIPSKRLKIVSFPIV
ncbi:MAG TPA: nicotinate phosphoribosyltransferase [Firmicutes bacterium]|jgi:nicotinate phosphoribosyltransferase|nr:nicotinate phosphoribosyltransferase [Bacillota bacterium]